MIRARLHLWGAAAVLFAIPLAAQQGAAGTCGVVAPCIAAVQAASSLRPQLAILAAGGSPTLGAGGSQGLRLGRLPGVSAALRLGLAELRAPDLTVPDASREATRAALSMTGTVSVRAFSGFSLAPTLAGVGELDLLGTLGMLPLGDGDGALDGGNVAVGGAGVRVGLIRESFTAPGAAVSVVYRRFGEAVFGEVCEPRTTMSGSARLCDGTIDSAEATIRVESWSTRAMVEKRIARIGLSGGIGYDRAGGDMRAAFISGDPVPTEEGVAARGIEDSDDGRWSAFGSLTGSALLLGWAVEAGWMQGGDPVAGYRAGSGYDPRGGTVFASVAARLAF